MNREQIKNLTEQKINEALSCLGHGESCPLSFEFGELLSDPKSSAEYQTYEADFIFEYGNIKRKHAVLIGWNDTDGIGFEYGEDGDLQDITFGNLMSHLYFDMAMEGLADEYMF